MISRFFYLRKNIRTYCQIRRYARWKPPYCDAHMNELPVPCGPWQVMYDKKQKYYNRTLLAGILWFIFSFAALIKTNAIFLNWAPPKWPAPAADRYDNEDECE